MHLFNLLLSSAESVALAYLHLSDHMTASSFFASESPAKAIITCVQDIKFYEHTDCFTHPSDRKYVRNDRVVLYYNMLAA